MTVEELKAFLNVDEDSTAHDGTLADLIAAAEEDLFVATGKKLDDDDGLIRQYIKLYAKREFDMLGNSFVDSRIRDIQKKILLSTRFEDGDEGA